MTLTATFPTYINTHRRVEVSVREQSQAALNYAEMDDNTLMGCVQNKDQDAMVALHSRYVNLLFTISLRVLHDAGMAEDSTQESFFKVWQSAWQFSPSSGTVAGWLSRIARNMAIDRQRMEHRRAAVNTDIEINEEIRPATSTPNTDTHPDEMNTAIRHALDRLPPEHAKLITLSYFGGLSHSDLSEMLGIPLGTVKTRIQMGMSRLRAVWSE